MYKLNNHGRKVVTNYIEELRAKRKEIIDAGKDTVNETSLPTIEDIEDDINMFGLDCEDEYYNGWAVTDHYDSDNPLSLKLGRDIYIVKED